MAQARSKQSGWQGRAAPICLAVAVAAPVVVFLGAAGLKTGLVPIETAYDLVAMKAGLALAAAGALAALVAVVAGLTAPRRVGVLALLTVLVSAATVAGYAREISAANVGGVTSGDVSTDPETPPIFSEGLSMQRERAGAGQVALKTGAACGVEAAPTQVAPGVAAYALQKAGFRVIGVGVARAEGVHTSFWFDRTHDAVLRIRPGRTDIRVTARDGLRDNDAACRLATRIAENLQVRK